MPAFHSVPTTVSVGGAIARVINVKANIRRETAEIRALDGSWVERVGGLFDGGTIELELAMDDSNFAALRAAQASTEPVSCSIAFANGSSLSCSVYVSELSPTASATDALTCSVRLTAAGALS